MTVLLSLHLLTYLLFLLHIIESVDSICRDSVTCNIFMIIQKIYQILKNGKLRSLYNIALLFKCFMTYKTPSSMTKRLQMYRTKKLPDNQCFSFFFFYSSKLRDSFTMVFAQNSSILHWAVYQPIIFPQPWNLTRHFKVVNDKLWLHL